MNYSNNSKPTFEILMSTTNNTRTKIADYNYVIINQLFEADKEGRDAPHVFNYHQAGVTKSRNKALEHAKADICLFSDDDVRFKKHVDRKIIEAFENNPRADIITFQIETPDGDSYKPYSEKAYWHNIKSLMKVSQVEVAFKRKSIIENNLRFDEIFGLGTTLPTGAEYIFLADALRKGLNILYIPEVIVIHPIESSGKNWNDADLIKAKGAVFHRVFGWKAYLWALVFSYKQSGLSSFSFFAFFYFMLKGINYHLVKAS